jgi:hypothetical protein
MLDAMVARRCAEADIDRRELRFTRRDALDVSGFGLTQLRLHLERLVDLELVLVHRGLRGQSFVYELLWDGSMADDEPHLAGLVDVDSLGGRGTTERWRGLMGQLAGPKRGQNGAKAGVKRGAAGDVKPALALETVQIPPLGKVTPYRNGRSNGNGNGNGTGTGNGTSA